jgi:hypothetical protein
MRGVRDPQVQRPTEQAADTATDTANSAITGLSAGMPLQDRLVCTGNKKRVRRRHAGALSDWLTTRGAKIARVQGWQSTLVPSK